MKCAIKYTDPDGISQNIWFEAVSLEAIELFEVVSSEDIGPDEVPEVI